MVVNSRKNPTPCFGLVIAGVIMYTYSTVPCMSMTITAFGHCSDVARLVSGTSVQEDRMSLHQCVQRCATRPACVLISHARLYNVCSLFDSVVHLPTTDGRTKDCVFVSKDDFDAENKQVSDECGVMCPGTNLHTSCNMTTRECDVISCEPQTNFIYGVIRGNLHKEGSRLKVDCDPGFTPESPSTQCVNGVWTHRLRCWRTATDDIPCDTFLVDGHDPVPDSALTASSFYLNDILYAPYRARLNSPSVSGISVGSWSAGTNNLDVEYIQVRFNQPSVVHGVAIQGRDDRLQWVTSYSVLYSVNCLDFVYVTENNGTLAVFVGSADQQTVVNSSFPPERALCLRIKPVSFHNYPSLRFDVIGCPEWQVVFLARPGISSWFGMDWQSGSASTTDSLLCLEDACNTHYRSSLLDSWTSSGIIKVRYSLHKGGSEAAYVEFRGQGSDMVNWFSRENVLASSWPGLAGYSFNKFSLNSGSSRMFYINLFWSGCDGDTDFTLVCAGWDGCPYCLFDSFPQFLYSVYEEPTKFGVFQGRGLADTMKVLVVV